MNCSVQVLLFKQRITTQGSTSSSRPGSDARTFYHITLNLTTQRREGSTCAANYFAARFLLNVVTVMYGIGKLWHNTATWWQSECLFIWTDKADRQNRDHLCLDNIKHVSSWWDSQRQRSYMFLLHLKWSFTRRHRITVSCLWYPSDKYISLCSERSGAQTMEPLEEERWMEWMRVARVFSRSCRMSQPGLSGGASYSSCLNGSNSIRITMFFKK